MHQITKQIKYGSEKQAIKMLCRQLFHTIGIKQTDAKA